MAQEIERKFLVQSDAYKAVAVKQTRIVQGYLSSVPERTVRVRVKGNQAYITVKGNSNASGISRYEWEKQITVEEANELFCICEPGMIDKIRYEVLNGAFVFEVDEFMGENAGLTIAEIELTSESDAFEKPEWLGREVTGNPIYYNAMLVKNPYAKWP